MNPATKAIKYQAQEWAKSLQTDELRFAFHADMMKYHGEEAAKIMDEIADKKSRIRDASRFAREINHSELKSWGGDW